MFHILDQIRCIVAFCCKDNASKQTQVIDRKQRHILSELLGTLLVLFLQPIVCPPCAHTCILTMCSPVNLS